MKILPLGDRILLRIIKVQEQGVIKGGLVIPESVTISGAAGVGEIVAVGMGYLMDKKTDDGKPMWESLESRVGERIIFNSRAGLALSKKFRFIRESEIIAKIGDDGYNIGDELLDGTND